MNRHTNFGLSALLLLCSACAANEGSRGRPSASDRTDSERASLSGALDGKTFHGTVGMKGDAQGDPDDFIFANGTFDSPACHEFGFGEGPYTANPGSGETNFEATTKDKNGATMRWKGTVKGKHIEGTIDQRTAQNEPLREMWFSGDQK